MPKRNIPNLYIAVQEGIDFDLIQSNKQIQNTIYNSVVIGIEEANVVVEIDINTFTQQDYAFLTQLNDIIAENNEVGMFELGNVKVNVESLESFEQDLIFIRK